MKLTCTQENLKRAVYNSERIASKQTTLPILNNILIEAVKNTLQLSATNLEMGVITKTGAHIEKEGKLTLSARLLSGFINNLPEGENIQIEGDGQVFKIRSGSTRSALKGLSAADFPLIPKKESDFHFQIESEKLITAIKKVAIAASLNETRQELTGINLIFDKEGLFFAATDSFRLAEHKITLFEKNINKEAFPALLLKKESIIIPINTLMEVGRIETEKPTVIKITVEEGQIFFETDETVLVSRLIGGKYPDYKHIIPKDFKTRIVGDKNLLQKAIKMASVFTSGKTSELKLKTNQEKKTVSIEVRSIETGENVSELNLDTTGENQEVVFNSRYLLDGINAIETSQVAILVNNGTAPVVLKEVDEKTGEVLDNYIYIVMPIKN
jgi:DNA polymerase-3 subunit beta